MNRFLEMRMMFPNLSTVLKDWRDRLSLPRNKKSLKIKKNKWNMRKLGLTKGL